MINTDSTSFNEPMYLQVLIVVTRYNPLDAFTERGKTRRLGNSCSICFHGLKFGRGNDWVSFPVENPWAVPNAKARLGQSLLIVRLVGREFIEALVKLLIRRCD